METRIPDRCMETPYTPRGLFLQWHVTERCNLRCAHCYQEGYKGEELSFQDLICILDAFKELLDAWKSQAGQRPARGHITVTGGEPFVRQDFLNLLEVFAENRDRFSFAILTNGSFIDASMARCLRRLAPRFVQVSLEGTQGTHEEIRGAGSFERAISAIQHLVRERIPTVISFTAHRGNYRDFPEVARLGRRLRVTRVWADRLIPSGSGEGLSQLLLTPEETRELFELMHQARTEATRHRFSRWVHRLLGRNGTEIAMHRALQFLVAGGRPYHCTAGDTLITVMPNGDLYPCRRMPIRVGNLLETPLRELYNQSDLFRALRDRNRMSDGCQECCFSRLCRGGLKCLSYAVAGDPFKADPGCWLAENKLSDGGER